MTSIESIISDVLAEGRTDWVPVDTVIGGAREVVAGDDGDFKPTAIAVIERLLLGGLMVAGEIGDHGFEQWPGTPVEVVQQVILKCESLHWEPFGAVCWLSNTEAGDRQASR
jgi:hypothetical protein